LDDPSLDDHGVVGEALIVFLAKMTIAEAIEGIVEVDDNHLNFSVCVDYFYHIRRRCT
jgi:hypothetical protein